MSWKVAHACVRGSSHRRSGLPNQDAAQCTVTPGPQGTVAVAVVSDGHGSPRHFRSQIGSSLAVSTAASTLQVFLRESVANNAQVPFVPEQVHELERKLVSVWLSAVHSDLENTPFTEAELAALEKEDGPAGRAEVEAFPELAYGATLLAAAATDKVVVYLQLGDGEILSVDAKGTTVRPLPPDDRLIGNQTTSLCQADAWKDFRSGWVTGEALPALVLLSTDGYSNSFRSDDDFLKIGQDYLEIIRQQGIASLAEELPAILTEATQQGSGDDITLAIMQDDLGPVGTTKTPRPLMTASSKSALIEQLKARHSSQQQKLQELAMRVEETRKDNQRLRNAILLLVAAAIAIPVWMFRARIFPHGPAATPIAPTMGKPVVEKKVAAPGPAHKGTITEWTLRVNGKDTILHKPFTITNDLIHPETKTDPKGRYAEVASLTNDDLLSLINYSQVDDWKVAGHTKKLGEAVSLGDKTITIAFTPHVIGTVIPIPEKPPAVASQH
jgi:serine/threonine protein phosphatase PrpC